MANFNNNKKINLLPLPYIGLFDLDVLYQTSDIELLYQILYKVNQIAESQNIIIENFEKILQWANEQIETYTKEQLKTWLNDGTLKNLINNLLGIISVFNTTNELINSANLIKGMKCKTYGYYNINDGGGSFWYVDDNVPTDKYYIEKDNLYIIYCSDKLNVKEIGMGYGNDDTVLFNSITYYRDIYIPSNTTLTFTNNININVGFHLYGDDNTSLINLNGYDIILKGGGGYTDVNTMIENFNILNGGFITGDTINDFANGVTLHKIYAFGNNTKNYFILSKNNTWLFTIDNCYIFNFNNGIYFNFESVVNSGAQIVISNTSIANSAQNGVLINSNAQDGYYIKMIGCDFEHCSEYSLKIENSGDCVVNLYNFHSELNTKGVIYNDNATVYYNGGWCNLNSTSIEDKYMFYNNSGNMYIKNVRIFAPYLKLYNIISGNIYFDDNILPADVFTTANIGTDGNILGSFKKQLYYSDNTTSYALFLKGGNIERFKSHINFMHVFTSDAFTISMKLLGGQYSQNMIFEIGASDGGLCEVDVYNMYGNVYCTVFLYYYSGNVSYQTKVLQKITSNQYNIYFTLNSPIEPQSVEYYNNML